MRRKKGRVSCRRATRLRSSLKLTQREFAALLGVSHPTVARWESGTLCVSAPCERLIEVIMNLPKSKIRHRLWREKLGPRGYAYGAFESLVIGKPGN